MRVYAESPLNSRAYGVSTLVATVYDDYLMFI